MPEINWDHYEKNISSKEVVASFKKAYQSVVIPPPSQEIIDEYKAQMEEHTKNLDEIKVACTKEIEDLEGELREFHAEKPIEQIQVDDLDTLFPDIKEEWEEKKKKGEFFE
eukprot:Sdes_comp14176_c0_seq2m3412